MELKANIRSQEYYFTGTIHVPPDFNLLITSTTGTTMSSQPLWKGGPLTPSLCRAITAIFMDGV